MGQATAFLRAEAETELFKQATGNSLGSDTMRDREIINRFCAFHLLDLADYRGDMDEHLAKALKRMNAMDAPALARLREDLHRALDNNLELFGQHAFRKHQPDQKRRSVFNASLWDVLTTGLAPISRDQLLAHKDALLHGFRDLLSNNDFIRSISYNPNGTIQARERFTAMNSLLQEVFHARAD